MKRHADGTEGRRGGVLARLLIALVVVAALIGGAALWIVRGGGGEGDLAQWVARRVVSIVEVYIVPDVSFETFAYEAPRTLTLRGVTLTSPDGTEVATAGVVTVEFAETPRRGQPIKIAKIGLDQGLLRLIAIETDGETGFEGLVPFVDREPVRNQEAVESDARLSNVLRISEVSLRDCGLYYAPLGDDLPPMELRGLTMDLQSEPVEERDEQGNAVVWHTIDAVIERGSAFVLDLDARIDLDRFVVELSETRLDMRLDGQNVAELPPQIQSLLNQHEARGGLEVLASGRVPIRDWRSSSLDLGVEMTDFNVAFGEYRFPLNSGRLTATMRDKRVTAQPIRLETLGGVVEASAESDLNQAEAPISANWTVTGLHLRELLRSGAPEGETPKLAGDLSTSGSANLEGAGGLETLTGSGELSIREGKLVIIPIVNELAETLNVLGMLRGDTGPRDEMDTRFEFAGPSVMLREFRLKTPAMAARGQGIIYFDGRLDMTMNAGPLERVQEALGEFGKIFGAITDRLVTYQVRGTVAEPKVSVRPLGLGQAGSNR